ncbi:hypothetical protein V8E54_011797 [Elaphomyces granulatus]
MARHVSDKKGKRQWTDAELDLNLPSTACPSEEYDTAAPIIDIQRQLNGELLNDDDASD